MIIALFSVCNALFGGVWLVRDPKRTVATICELAVFGNGLGHSRGRGGAFDNGSVAAGLPRERNN